MRLLERLFIGSFLLNNNYAGLDCRGHCWNDNFFVFSVYVYFSDYSLLVFGKSCTAFIRVNYEAVE